MFLLVTKNTRGRKSVMLWYQKHIAILIWEDVLGNSEAYRYVKLNGAMAFDMIVHARKNALA